MLRYIPLLCAVLITDGCTKNSQSKNEQSEPTASKVTLFQAKDLGRESLEKYAADEQEVLVGDRCRCAPGATGPQGPEGPQGPPGGGGSAQTIHFSMSLPLFPSYDFAFFPSNGGGAVPVHANADSFTPIAFNYASTNPTPPDYAYTFLVPEYGEIYDLIMRINFTSLGIIAPTFTFTVYKSSANVDDSGPVTGWTSAGLSETTGAVEVGIGNSTTLTYRNFSEPSTVNSGDLLTVVVSSGGFLTGQIGSASLAVSFKYIETPTAK